MEPWVMKLSEELNLISTTSLSELAVIINRMGMNEKNKSEWITIIREQVAEVYKTFLDDAKTFQNTLIDSIEELLKESEELCKQLHIQMPPHGASNLSNLNLSEEKALLKERVTEYQSMVETRKKEVHSLRKRQLEACKSLGREPLKISENPLPTMDDLDNLAHHIEKLEDEKFQRESKFIDVKCKILDIVNELGIKPSLEIEKTVCSPDDSLFNVTDYNMKWIEEYYESLVQQKNQTINEIAHLREKVGALWEILSEDIKNSNEFLQRHTGNSLATLEALQSEVKRCENLKKANIEKFIKKMRDELIIMWEKCHFSASERNDFAYFYDHLYTEDLLTFHDIEVEKMKKYYEENKTTLMMLEKREEYWKIRVELEEKARDPNRFKNRGGILLKEEKERNGITKRINEMEQELLQIAENYEMENHKPFLSWGKTIADIIEKTHDDYEHDKKQQLSAKKQQRNLTVTPAKSGYLGSTPSTSKKTLLKLTPSNTTAHSSALKRKLPPTALFSGTKKKTPLKETTKMNPKILLNNKTIVDQKKRIRYSNEKKKRLQKIRRLSKLLDQKKRTINESMDYDEFEKEIADKQSCRSTLFAASSNALAFPLPQTPKTGRTPQRCRTPTRTPSSTRLRTAPGSKMDI